MKKYSKLIIPLIVLCFLLCACGDAGQSADATKVALPEKHLINTPEEIEEFSVGDSAGDDIYFKLHDYYNMQSSGSLLMISHFETYRQHLTYGCGPSAAYMVLNYLDKEKAANYNEDKIAEICGSTGGGIGTSAGQIADFFEKEIGWDCIYHMGHSKEFSDYESFVDNLVKWNLEEGKPIIVDWNIGGGHWTVIIGFDDMGTETTSDDVLIFADSSDNADNYHDGYNSYSAVRFFRQWKEFNAFDGEKVYVQQYVVVEK